MRRVENSEKGGEQLHRWAFSPLNAKALEKLEGNLPHTLGNYPHILGN